MSLVTYKHAIGGTRGMQKHIDSCSKTSLSIEKLNNDKITSYFNSVKNKSYQVPRELKDKITNGLTECIILDNKLFEIVRREDFTNLIDIILDIGRRSVD